MAHKHQQGEAGQWCLPPRQSHMKPAGLTRRGAGGSERGAGALTLAGPSNLRLVEGALQLPSPLVTAILLFEVLEDLLCWVEAEEGQEHS